MSEPSLRSLRCGWPSCKSLTVYGTIQELQNHQTDVHVADVFRSWPGSCSWPGCKSKIFFKTRARLESHVYNIHVTPLICTTVGCTHKRPFERTADLERHALSKHTAKRKYRCPQQKCDYAFSRKDKFKLHERTCHGQFACQQNHCIYGFHSEEKALKDGRRCSHHYIFECRLGSCEHTSVSRFMRRGLERHLEYDHLIPLEGIKHAMENISLSVTLKVAHFPDGFSDFQDCKGCIEKLKEAASRKEAEEI